MALYADTFQALFDFEALSAVDDGNLFAWIEDGDLRLAIDNSNEVGNDLDLISPIKQHIIHDNFAFIDPAKLDLKPSCDVGLKLQSCSTTQPSEQASPTSAVDLKEQIDHDVEQPLAQPTDAVTRRRAPRTTIRHYASGSRNTALEAKPNNEGCFLVFSAFDNHPRALSTRRRLGPSRRKEVHEVRKIGSCVRCQLLKKPVRPASGPFLHFMRG